MSRAADLASVGAGIASSANATAISISATEVVTLLTSALATSEGGAVTTNIAQGLAKVWAHIAAGGASLSDSLNCSSIDDDGTGEYGVNIATDMASANYSATSVITFQNLEADNLRVSQIESKAAGSVEMDFTYVDSSGNAIPKDLETNASVTIHGDLA